MRNLSIRCRKQYTEECWYKNIEKCKLINVIEK